LINGFSTNANSSELVGALEEMPETDVLTTEMPLPLLPLLEI
jgi:hypothetical protein